MFIIGSPPLPQSAYVTITRDFEGASPSCKDNIRHSWQAIEVVGSEGQPVQSKLGATASTHSLVTTGFPSVTGGGLEWLSKTFRLCQPLHRGSGVQTLTSWIQDTWFNLAMGMIILYTAV